MSEPKAQLVDPQENMNLPGMNATGVITASSFSGEGGVVTGLTGSPNLNVGVVTATSFVGDGTGHAANLTGTPNLNLGLTTATSFIGDAVGKAAGLTGTPNLNVGLVTATSFAGNVTGDVTGNITGLAASVTPGVNLNVGVCTAIQYHGNGANLTGAGSSAYIAQEVTASGDETIIDLSDGNLIYLTQSVDGAETTVGFASTSPAEQLTIIRNPDTSSAEAWNISLSTGGVDFDGSDDRLDTTLITAPGTSDFTLEYWVKQDTLTNWQTHFATTRGSGFNVGTDASGDFVFFTSNAGGRAIEVVGAITTGVWYHWAFVRTGGVTTGYINGIARASFSDSYDYSPTTASIGNLVGENSEYTNGVISNLRLVVGTALYTKNFTPPSSALTNVTNTKLLCCQSTTDDTAAAVGNTLNATSSPTAGAQTVTASGTTAITYSITWPSTVKWKDNLTPTLINNRRSAAFQIFHLTTGDTGASYQAWEEMKDNPTGGPYTLWAWGYNNYGQLAQNNLTSRSSPTQIPGTTWNQMPLEGSAGADTSNSWISVKTDGTLWAWGHNEGGELGQNDVNDGYSSPAQIGADTTWSHSAGDDAFHLAIKTDGTLWSWGRNLGGELGLNETASWPGSGDTKKSSPTQIPGVNWSKVTCGYRQTMATKTDGTLWTWGGNGDGSLGLNESSGANRKSSPCQIGTGSDWSDPVCGRDVSAAIKTNGTLWMWGRGHDGATGQNNRTNYSSPRQVPGTTWKNISIGTQPYVVATKTDGTAWAWGDGTRGNLGLNTAILYSSPVQIPGTTWSQAVAAEFQSQATKTDGTLWTWGDNTNSGTYGSLGLNDLTQRSSPTQIPGTDWMEASGGAGFGMAFKLSS